MRQRIQAAVKAERADVAGKDGQVTTESARRATISPASGTDLFDPAANGISGPRKPGHAAKPGHTAKPERAAKAVKPKPAAKPERTSRREHPAGRLQQPSRRRSARIRLIALALALVAIGSLITVVSLYVSGSSSGNHRVPAAVLRNQEATARTQAATWVTQQVNPADTVSCDPVMCHALQAAGFQGKLLVLGPTSQPPVTSAVVVVTEAVRDLFGSSIDSAWAPAVLTSIGSGGAAQVTIRVIAPDGAVPYQAQLTSGQASRTKEGEDLEGNYPQIKLSESAKANLAAGQVDPRLLLALLYLAGNEPIDILGFGNVGPGASAGLLLRYADLDVDGKAENMTSAAYVQAMQGFLAKAQTEILPTSSQPIVLSSGRVFRIQFSAPSPFTLADNNS